MSLYFKATDPPLPTSAPSNKLKTKASSTKPKTKTPSSKLQTKAPASKQQTTLQATETAGNNDYWCDWSSSGASAMPAVSGSILVACTFNYFMKNVITLSFK